MKRTSKRKRPRKTPQSRPHLVQSKYHLVDNTWLIYFSNGDKMICGITPEGDIDWADGATQHDLKRAWENSITLGLETLAEVRKGARRRMVLKSFKHIRNKIKKMDKKEMVKYLNTTIKTLEKKETIRILRGN